RDEVEREIEEEIRLHIEMRTDANIAAGMDERAARADALHRMGDIDAIRITGRRILVDSPPPRRRGGIVDTARQDVRNALRVLRRSPAFAATVVVVLALGIGATSTMFSVIDAVLLRPLPHPDIERLMEVTIDSPVGDHSRDLVDAWKRGSRMVEAIDHWNRNGVTTHTLAGRGAAVSVMRQRVGVDFFLAIGVEPTLGRTFLPDDMEQGASTTVILSHDLWSRHFGADPTVLGDVVEMEGGSRTIIGIMPSGFRIDPLAPAADVWVARDSPGRWISRAAARLEPGVSAEQAAAELEGIARGVFADKDGAVAEGDRLRVSVSGFGEPARDRQGVSLYRLLAVVALVLMICCANVSGLLLLRSATRQRELSTRRALGASRWRLARELTAESAFLSLLGAAAGVVLATWGIRLFVVLSRAQYGGVENFRIDSRVLGFALVVSLVAGVLSGLIPALRFSATSLGLTFPRGTNRRRPGRLKYSGDAFVVSQVALSVVLLISAGLMINSLARATNIDHGFDPEGLAVMRIRAQGSGYELDEPEVLAITPQVERFYEQLLARLASYPGIESVALITPPAALSYLPFEIVGRPAQAEDARRWMASYVEASTDYFHTMRMALVKGRFFRRNDDASAPPVAIISQALADEYFGDDEPLGQFIHADLSNGVTQPKLVGDVPREVVGVVSTEVIDSLEGRPKFIYVPFRQHLAVYPVSRGFGIHVYKHVVARTSSDPADLLGPMQQAVTEADPTQVAEATMTMDQWFAERLPSQRFWMKFLSICAGTAIVLAALGLYTVIARSVTARTHELGVRMALGAEKGSVCRLILRHALILAVLGVGIGAAAALGFTRLLSNRLYGVTPTDPATFAAVGLGSIVVALLASYAPARRATNVDAVVALRED
ncbi:MAG: ABC transporter permease, partial [Acidobacteriota bacterium]